MSDAVRQIYLGMVIHNHQPLGNFPWVFEEAYRQAYSPLIEALERHPLVRLSMHNSGCLIDWLKQNHPEYISRLGSLVSRGQVEMVGGGYYEPILPAIPDEDKVGQIGKMKSFLEKQFGSKPTGLWLAERVWEPHLTKILAEAGVEWTMVDDLAFKWVGVDDKDLFGYYITEEQGSFVKTFPISKHLRYAIPWHDVEKVIDYLLQQASDGVGKIAILGDDGEKFGIWPGTFEHCWEKGWVDKFFAELERNQHWLHTITIGEYARKFPPLGRIYLPCASYDEMLEWSLPADKSWEYTRLKHRLEAEARQDILQFVHSGLWRNFLVKYPEINRLHKKMLRVHSKVYQARGLANEDCGLEELWKGQCNCPYWHGVFGGIYLSDIRAATYSQLIQAEKKADKIIHRHHSGLGRVSYIDKPWLEWYEVDFDGDGGSEFLFDSDALCLYLSPSVGGSIFEWDLRGHNYNVCSTMARRPEVYHRALLEANAEQQKGCGDAVQSIHDSVRIKDKSCFSGFVYDRHFRSSLVDHFLNMDAEFSDFAKNTYLELGNFNDQPYELVLDRKGDVLKIGLGRHGNVLVGNRSLPFAVQKEIRIKAGSDRMEIGYRLENTSNALVEAVFGNEWNINLLGGGHNKQAYYQLPGITLYDCYLDSWGELPEVNQMSLVNRQLGIELELTTTPKVKLWRFPVESVSNSEGGVERIYQSSCLVALFPFSLHPGGTATLDITWQVKSPRGPI